VVVVVVVVVMEVVVVVVVVVLEEVVVVVTVLLVVVGVVASASALAVVGPFTLPTRLQSHHRITGDYFSVVRSRVIAQAVRHRPFSVEVGFDPTPATVRLLMDKCLLQVLRCSPITTIPLVFHIHSLIFHRSFTILALDSIVE
jgi:hypothetical protein